jgi:hypothetical protein
MESKLTNAVVHVQAGVRQGANNMIRRCIRGGRLRYGYKGCCKSIVHQVRWLWVRGVEEDISRLHVAVNQLMVMYMFEC